MKKEGPYDHVIRHLQEMKRVTPYDIAIEHLQDDLERFDKQRGSANVVSNIYHINFILGLLKEERKKYIRRKHK